MIEVFGIPNCDTVKKARAWLNERGLAHRFHDFKKTPPDAQQCLAWAQALGPSSLINRRGTTWRQCTPDQQAAADTPEGAAALAQAQPSVIKRPLVQWADGELSVGFNAQDWAQRV
jgi:Spx/MgsR family transcriptional regulator